MFKLCFSTYIVNNVLTRNYFTLFHKVELFIKLSNYRVHINFESKLLSPFDNLDKEMQNLKDMVIKDLQVENLFSKVFLNDFDCGFHLATFGTLIF